MDPAAVALLAALIGAGASIAATALTMWWSGRHDAKRQELEEAATLRAEKRMAYADLIRALHVWREATAELADGDRKKRDWESFWAAREKCMKAGATLQLVGTYDMIDTASEVMEALLDVGWKFQTHTALAFGDHPPDDDQISQSIWAHIGVADREEATLLDLMRVDLGFAALGRQTPTPARPADTDLVKEAIDELRQ